jgi:hypothetical protein
MPRDPEAAQSASQITEATVCRGDVARIGSRVKHYGQRWTGCATATVVGFRDVGHASPDRVEGYLRPSWIKVLVKPDRPNGPYGNTWDWDRTEVAPDVG